jgi:pheromone shutdown protein TraB
LITLIGTGHVFDIGARVREEIRRRAPQVVGIELDGPRYHALRNKNKDRSGTPVVYRLLADFQTRIANQYGVEAGDEMLAASDEAKALNVPLALIDKDAQQTFARLRKEMRFGEKMRLFGSAVVGLLPILPGKSIEKQVEEMQEDYASYFTQMEKQFPTLKRVLLDERNEHMARALQDLARTNERVVAVVGDGHVDGIHAILKGAGLDVETVRLKELRAKSAAAAPQGNATASLTVTVEGTSPPPRG